MRFSFQMTIEKKVMPFLQSLSLKTLALALSSSFILATALSIISAYVLLPDEGKPKKVLPPRGQLSSDAKGLTGAQQKVVLDRNIFNSEGKLGDVVEQDDSQKQTSDENLVESSLPIKVKGIIFSGDPYNGLALLENTQKRRVKSYVVGDTVIKSAKLVEIYDNRVIVLNGGQREYIESEEFKLVRSRH